MEKPGGCGSQEAVERGERERGDRGSASAWAAEMVRSGASGLAWPLP